MLNGNEGGTGGEDNGVREQGGAERVDLGVQSRLIARNYTEIGF